VTKFEGLVKWAFAARTHSRNVVRVGGLDGVVVAQYSVTLLFGSRSRDLAFWPKSILVSAENFEAVLLLLTEGDGSDVLEFKSL
jgi:hypothetical protein